MPIRATNQSAEQIISFADIIRQAEAEAITEVAAEARAAGIDPTQTRALDNVVQIFVTENDERVRPSHAALHNTQWDPNDPNAPIPPLDYGCRCHLEFRAKNPAAAKRTGLPLAPTRPPVEGDQAFEQYFKTAKTSPQAAEPGAQVKPTDILGQKSGALLEAGKIRVSDVFSPELIPRQATTLENIAKARQSGRSVAAVTGSTTFLRETFGISNSIMTSMIKEARAIQAASSSLSDLKALEEALVKKKPGFVGGATDAATARRAQIVAKRILKIIGSLNK